MKYRFLSLSGILIGMGSSAVMQTYLSVSMPSIVRELGGMTLYNWVFGAYLLASTVSIPLSAKMADLFGRRKLYMAGLILFTIGLLLCGLSLDMPMLVACRALMGLGAGTVTPAALGMIGELFDKSDFPRVFGLMGVIQVLSNLIGPLLGGFLSDAFSWRWGFMLFLPLELACGILICLGPAASPPGEDGRQKGAAALLKELDWIGAILLSSGLVFLISGVQLISRKEPSAGISLFVLALLLLAFSIRWEKHCKEPLLPLDLLRTPAVRTGMISVFFLGIINNSSTAYLSLYYQDVLGNSPTKAGILLIPMLVSAGAAGAVCGKLPNHILKRTSLYLWFAAGLSFAGISFIGNLWGGLAAVFFSIPAGLALGFMLPLFLGDSQITADNSNRAAAGGLVQLSRNLGGTMGVSLLGIWISGVLPVDRGLAGIFLNLAAVSIFAFIYMLIDSRQQTREATK